jgi:hypothetical protein
VQPSSCTSESKATQLRQLLIFKYTLLVVTDLGIGPGHNSEPNHPNGLAF